MEYRLSISSFRSSYHFLVRRGIHYPTLPAVSKGDKSLWSDKDLQIYTLIKVKKFHKALPIIDQMRKDRTPIAPPLLRPSLQLYLKLGPQMRGLRDILSYLKETSLLQAYEKLVPPLIERAVIQRDTESIVQMLDVCFLNEIPIRMTSFTQAMDLLAQSQAYAFVQGYVTQYLDSGYMIEEKLLEVVCTEFIFSKSPYLLYSLLLILVHYTKLQKFIQSSSVFNKVADCLEASGQFSSVKRTFLSDEKCFNCGTHLAMASLTPDMYHSLEAGVRKSIEKSQEGKLKSSDLQRLDYDVDRFIDSLGCSDSPGVIVDASTTSRAQDFKLDDRDKEDLNLKSLLSLTSLVRRKTKCAGVFLLAQRVNLRKHDGTVNLELLRDSVTIYLLNRYTSHYLFALLATLKLRSRGLLITNQTYGHSLHALPTALRPLYMSWYINHVIRSGIHELEPHLYRIDRIQWRPEFSDVSLHIPMADNNWICAQADEGNLDT